MRKYIPVLMIMLTVLFVGTALGFTLARYTSDTTIVLAKHWLESEEATQTVPPDTLGKINLNNASLSQLCMLPGIGESTAKAIISYREDVSPFLRIEDILEIEGIGKAKFQKIKDYITVTSGG
ncbi:MAG: helix-hairpin-helix domain-containing protein [Oscillospiraceae bacterium]|nr:helix-hairpin-helix domain-containing protein [Oscillospiraceae bacterium]